MIKNILLINVPLSLESTTSFFVMPIGLLSVASYLKENGENPIILDLNTIDKNNIFVELENNLLNLRPSLVGISVMVAGQFNIARKILQKVKELYPNIISVVGGAHVTQFPKFILENCPEIDFVVLGEGERQLLDCVKYSYDYKKPKVWSDGIAYRENNNIKIIPKQSFLNNLNDLPNPGYNLINFNKYKQNIINWHNPYKQDLSIRVPIITSRGCCNLCNFCSVSGCMGNIYRALTYDRVVDLIQELHEKYNSFYFSIFDSNFTHDRKRVINICEEIKKRNIKICLDLPTGIPINKTFNDIVDALADIGLIRTAISVESGDEKIRNEIMKKNIKNDDIFILVEYIRKYPHIQLTVDFVLGMPEDTEESVDASCNIIKSLDIDNLVLALATPYPGTELYKQCIKDNLFFEDINYNNLWCTDWYTHSNINKFIIKPYKMDLKTLEAYRDKILELRDIKINNYKKRMKDIFNIDSQFKPTKE